MVFRSFPVGLNAQNAVFKRWQLLFRESVVFGGLMQPVVKGTAMISKATNGKSLQSVGNADACFEAMRKHHLDGARPPAGTRTQAMTPSVTPASLVPAPSSAGGGNGLTGSGAGDIIYGARAIAQFIFGDGSDRARRRVFNIGAHHMKRKEPAGFFKLKGALCLSKALWRAFHGLG